MNNDRFTHALAPFLTLCAIVSILFVSVHAATTGLDDLRLAARNAPKHSLVYVKVPPATQPGRLTALAMAKHG